MKISHSRFRKVAHEKYETSRGLPNLGFHQQLSWAFSLLDVDPDLDLGVGDGFAMLSERYFSVADLRKK